MNIHFDAFINLSKKIANQKNVQWFINLNTEGIADKLELWNLTKMTGGSPPPSHIVRDFGMDEKTLSFINVNLDKDGKPLISKAPLSDAWQDFIKAAIIEQLLIRKNTTGHVVSNVARPLRVIATCNLGVEPWELGADNILKANTIALSIQPSGKLADILVGLVKTIFDANFILDKSPLYSTLSLPRNAKRAKRSNFTKSEDELRNNLEDRKNQEKLPKNRAFWELVRIVFTEQPQSFLDLLRFAQIKLLILCGMRVGEVALLPADWKRTRDYYDTKGTPAGNMGGYSQALMLRYFAEKQQLANSDSMALFEDGKYIPTVFAEIITSTLEQVVQATKPLLETLKLQSLNNRMLPWFDENALVSAIKLYPYLTGNPILVKCSEEYLENVKTTYRSDFNPVIFEEMHQSQFKLAKSVQLNMALYVFYNRMKAGMAFRDSKGRQLDSAYIDWNKAYLRISDVEKFYAENAPTKLSDSSSFKLQNGEELKPWELMFLMPKRALAEGRNGGMCDVNRYFSVGRMDASMIQNSLSGKHASVTSIFKTYSQSDEDRKLKINTHSFRHLLNTELFRQGVADTIITKQFNRRSVTQSYVYDHRSLAEELAAIEIPSDVEISLGEKSSTVWT